MDDQTRAQLIAERDTAMAKLEEVRVERDKLLTILGYEEGDTFMKADDGDYYHVNKWGSKKRVTLSSKLYQELTDARDSALATVATLTGERDALKAKDEESLKLFMRFDCDWGCGCGKRHCDAHKPCTSHRLAAMTAEVATMRGSWETEYRLREKAESTVAEMKEDLAGAVNALRRVVRSWEGEIGNCMQGAIDFARSTIAAHDAGAAK